MIDRLSAAPSPPPVDSYGKKRTLNAVDDLGWDPNGKKVVSKPPRDEGTLIKVPPGTYLVGKRWDYLNLKDWGLIGVDEDGDPEGVAPDDVRFLVKKGVNNTLFNIRGGNHYLLANFVLDMREDWDSCLGLKMLGKNMQLRSVHYRGWRPSEKDGATPALNVFTLNHTKGDAWVVDFYADERTRLVDYPKNAIMLGSFSPSYGTLHVQDSMFENGGEHGIYASRVEGPVQIDRCVFKNNQNTQVRVSGEGSYVRDSLFLWDDDSPNAGSFQAQTGLTWEAGFQGFTGGHVENCRFICRATAPNSGVLKVDGSHGGVNICDSVIYVASGARTPAINIESPGDSHMIDRKPAKPWDTTLENVHVVHDGGQLYKHDASVRLRGRDGSTVEGLCLDASRSRLNATRLEKGTYRFGPGNAVASPDDRRRLVKSGATVEGWNGVTTEPDCITPDASIPSREDVPIAPDEPMIDNPTFPTESPSYPHVARVLADEGVPITQYHFEVSGPVSRLSTGEYPAEGPEATSVDEITENDDGTTTVVGTVARGGGDTFEFDGSITAFGFDNSAAEDAVYLLVDGKKWTPPTVEPEPEPTPDPDPVADPRPPTETDLKELADQLGYSWVELAATSDVVLLTRHASTTGTNE